MPLSNSVIRRYTPPTCTLEVLAQSSPLSRWMGKSVLKQVRFNLRFDDPRQPEKELIIIQGDRDQLEALSTAVSGYVQEILQQSPENFWASRVEAHSASKTSEPTSVEDVSNLEPNISNPRNEFAYRGNIYLQPSSNLTHQLFLGSLANQVSGASIQLGLLQLFDLATALDEYMADVVALPSERSQPGINRFAIPGWAPVAAVLVLGLGLMPLTLQYANRLRENKTGETVATANKEIGNDPASTLLTPLPTPQSSLTPLPTLSPLPNLGTGLNLPNASSPVPGASPLPTLAATQKPGTTFPSASTNPSSSLSNIPLLPSGSDSFGSSAATKPQLEKPPFPLTPNSPGSKPNLGGNVSGSTPTSKTSLPSLTNPSTAKLPENPSKQTGAIPQTGNDRNDLLTNLPKSNSIATESKENNPTTTAAANSETLFDTNQVVEVRNYLSKRWKPPSGLSQPLEYSMTVGVDGALEQILPLGKAARDYVDSAGIPKIGQPFVSSSRNGQNVRLRAVLNPNGKVQVFPETD
ncbi:DUF4335 domain-containing protein [Calothrix sp. CCY 0018]|uniref:DUF4335 domain-containing protein n=1 Tax=Calothrix sp. CCY 0018 TaxID=3103864 RepID=UPI0039C5D689